MDTSRWGWCGQNLSSGRQTGKGVGPRPLAERCLVRGQNLLRESRLGAHCTARPAALCRLPDYAESSMKHLHLALSWSTETIKPIRHSREGVIVFARISSLMARLGVR